MKVVAFLRKRYPHVILIPGLGELQTSDEARIQSWQKGYTAGQPDLILLKPNSQYHGMVLEFKSPKNHEVKANHNQMKFLARFRKLGYKTLLTNVYEDILIALVDYLETV